MESYDVLIRPLISEKAVNMIETENKIVFLVRNAATKLDIKKAMEKEYKVKVDNVNTVITRKGQKRAIIKLAKEFKASDLSNKLGMV